MSRTPQEHDTHESLNRSRSGLVGMPAALLPGIVNNFLIGREKEKKNNICWLLTTLHGVHGNRRMGKYFFHSTHQQYISVILFVAPHQHSEDNDS
jgi:hypothetical protein